MWLRNRPRGIFPLQTKRVPAALDELLPRIACAARDGNATLLDELIVGRPELWSKGSRLHLGGMSVFLAGMFAKTAVGSPDPVPRAIRDEFFSTVVDVGRSLPEQAPVDKVRRLVDFLLAPEDPLDSKIRMSTIDIATVCCFVAIQGAAARRAAWSDANVMSLYEQSRKAYEHTAITLK